ncbi:DNA polymerase III subunit delta' [Rhodobacter sp. KR11]|uniref:DNA polymerase III subunit delta' n=1 Tax=Rhodobacter sp. KR11 TaxID=2974588 RepID=UPI00222349D4|nr:DNA polymerase III subunit delta' [Rhodobacter sp. KR11]MCW1919357.1 DNA polymerase III subunit delta' [Rhodobacter sp. KR11]
MSDIPEPDRLEGAPHPRETHEVLGHARAEAVFLDAFNSGRMHHAWLISGPKGVGKATLAWRIARFLLATPEDEGPDSAKLFAPPPPRNLDIPDDHPVAHRLLALSEPRLFLLRRPWDDKTEKLRAEITVDETRALRNFLGLSAADGGRRVVLIDAADDLNRNAANAILKLLEEPPAKVTFLIVTHQPAGLLPTIRSRTRDLRLASLPADLLARAMHQAGAEITDAAPLAELAGGSVGEAFRLTHLQGLDQYGRLVRLLATLPQLDRPMARVLADAASDRKRPEAFDLTVTLIDLFLARLARAGTTREIPPEAAPGEAALIERLAADPAIAREWADLAQHLGLRARKAKAVNLDPSALILDMFLRMEETAALVAHR